MVIGRDRQLDQQNAVKIGKYCFEKVESFRYLEIELNRYNDYIRI